jgi:hypothetical protein
MKLPKNLILMLVFAGLAGSAWWYQGPYQQLQKEKSAPKNFLYLEGEIDAIEIEQSEKKVNLKKEGEGWRIYGQDGKFYVGPNQIRVLLDTLNGIGSAKLEIASNNPGRQEEFKLSGEERLSVKLQSGDNEMSFLIGKETPGGLGSYVGREGDDNTYRLNRVNLRQQFAREEWRDYSIYNLDFKQPTYLRLQYRDHETKMELKGEDWVNANGKVKYNKEQIDKLSQALVSLVAIKIPKQDFKPAGLDKPAMIIQFKGDGFDETLMLGKKTADNLYYAKTGDSDNLYLISDSDYDLLTQPEKKPVSEPKDK